jgi:hypothetical protein
MRHQSAAGHFRGVRSSTAPTPAATSCYDKQIRAKFQADLQDAALTIICWGAHMCLRVCPLPQQHRLEGGGGEGPGPLTLKGRYSFSSGAVRAVGPDLTKLLLPTARRALHRLLDSSLPTGPPVLLLLAPIQGRCEVPEHVACCDRPGACNGAASCEAPGWTDLLLAAAGSAELLQCLLQCARHLLIGNDSVKLLLGGHGACCKRPLD